MKTGMCLLVNSAVSKEGSSWSHLSTNFSEPGTLTTQGLKPFELEFADLFEMRWRKSILVKDTA